VRRRAYERHTVAGCLREIELILHGDSAVRTHPRFVDRDSTIDGSPSLKGLRSETSERTEVAGPIVGRLERRSRHLRSSANEHILPLDVRGWLSGPPPGDLRLQVAQALSFHRVEVRELVKRGGPFELTGLQIADRCNAVDWTVGHRCWPTGAALV